MGDAEMIYKDPLCATGKKIIVFESQAGAKLFICFHLYMVGDGKREMDISAEGEKGEAFIILNRYFG